MKHRIIKKLFKDGSERFIVQYKCFFWWGNYRPSHVGNKNIDYFDEKGYEHHEAALKQMSRLVGQELLKEEVVGE